MKLRQREHCHNCNQQVIFEFEDITERQVIICPNCSHQHYRELDNATILDIQIDQTRGLGQFTVAKMPEFNMEFREDEGLINSMVEVTKKTYDIVGYDDNGKPMLSGDPNADGFKVNSRRTKRVTERRWGVDPRQ